MAKKTLNELLNELPELVKKSTDFQIDKTVGTIGLYDIILDIIDSLVISGTEIPVGGIINWSGSINNIPTNWSLCNGTLGTPNLIDRFILGSGNIYPTNTIGGTINHSHSGSVVGHSISVSELPSHTHTYRAYVQSGSNSGSGGEDAGFFQDVQTQSKGSGLPHTHSLNILNSQTILPPYYALAYIMYQGVDWVPGVSIKININININSINTTSNELFFTISGGTITNGLNLQYSTDGINWSSSAGGITSPRNVSSFNPINGSFFRLQSLDNLTTYSNDIQFII